MCVVGILSVGTTAASLKLTAVARSTAGLVPKNSNAFSKGEDCQCTCSTCKSPELEAFRQLDYDSGADCSCKCKQDQCGGGDMKCAKGPSVKARSISNWLLWPTPQASGTLCMVTLL